MKNIIGKINVFVLLTICYVILTFAVKISELIFTLLTDVVVEDFSGMLYGNLVSALFVSLCVFLPYLLISSVSKKIATYISAVLFSIMLLFETGLVIYHVTTGLLMGSELVNRPLWEILHTIGGVVDIWIIILSFMVMLLLTLLFVRFSRICVCSRCSWIIVTLMFVSVPMVLSLKPNQDKSIVNKIWYCLYSCLNDNSYNDDFIYNSTELAFEERYVRKYKEFFPDRRITNSRYPLEREDNIPNVLGTYFRDVDTKPNIVFVIVESLGSDLFGQNAYGYTATPFLDSLSRHSLLWTNCLSTTARSAGVLPAVTASVPHGTKGFQFGDIPECNSLFTILKDNGYRSSVFYSGSFNFDRVSDYLLSQRVDYMSPFYRECSKNKSSNEFDYTVWGYHDKKMFQRSMEVIKGRDVETPNMDIFVTISQHDNKLILNSNKDLEKYYHEMTDTLLQSLPDDESKKLMRRKGFIAAFLYSDDALREFFHSYTKRYNNTIFIITGDHSLNFYSSNPLSAYHVPLIIWSPFLEKPQRFQSVVSHNDIAPSLNALLRDNFNIKTPEYVHWISDGLDTTQSFRSDVKTCFMTQTNISTKLVFNDLYYSEEAGEKKLYRIKENLEVERIEDTELMNMMKERTNVLQYIDRYVYTNNRLTNNPINPYLRYDLINSVDIDSAYCSSKDTKPSVSGNEKTRLHLESVAPGFSQIKVVLTADMMYTADVHHHDFVNLNIKSNNSDWYSEVISKNIVGADYAPGKWLKVQMTKNISLKDIEKSTQIELYMSSPQYDSRWNPEHSVYLKNINIRILGVNANNQ